MTHVLSADPVIHACIIYDVEHRSACVTFQPQNTLHGFSIKYHEAIVVVSLKDSSCDNPQPNINFDSWFQLKYLNNRNRPTDSQLDRIMKEMCVTNKRKLKVFIRLLVQTLALWINTYVEVTKTWIQGKKINI